MEALELDPQKEGLDPILGQIYELSHHHPHVLFGLAKIHQARKDTEASQQRIEQYLQILPDDFELTLAVFDWLHTLEDQSLLEAYVHKI